ncbi:MAG: carbohydrate kinase [Caldilineales bacterium]|nr:carbohydrate kinase [Caldilineales bacterium]
MHIVTLGESLIDMFPAEVGRKLVEVSAFIPSPGGAPANTAVAARRLGAEVAFIGKVGDDIFGRHLFEHLAAQGVDTRGMRVDNYARTTMAIIAMADENTPEFVFYRNPGADTRLEPEELDAELLASTRNLHVGSLSLSDEPSRSATFEAVWLARQGGAFISFDVNYRPSLWSTPEEALTQIWEMLPRADVVKVNEDELALLAGGQKTEVGGRRQAEVIADLTDKCEKLLSLGPKLILVTLGRHGSFFCIRDGSGFVPAFPVETVDAVGCGDAFMAGMLTQLTRSENWRENLTVVRLHEMLRYANAVGAITATKKGVIPALPTAAQVDDFLAAR